MTLKSYLRFAWHSIVCGRHSNIPWHCILWWLTGDVYLGWPMEYREWARRVNLGRRAGYVQCPHCVVTKRVPNTVLRCGRECARKKWLYKRKEARNK